MIGREPYISSQNESDKYEFSTNIYEPLTEDNDPQYSWFDSGMLVVRNDSIGFHSLFDSDQYEIYSSKWW